MKKTLAAVAVLGAFAGSALAADVTLYGKVDLGLQYSHSETDFDAHGEKDVSSHKFEMKSGGSSSSRFGLKGVEDISEGLKVGFQLEHGFSADQQEETKLFSREMRLYVASDYGTLHMGRFGALDSATGSLDMMGDLAATTGYLDVIADIGTVFHKNTRMANSVAYTSPEFAGITLSAMASLGEDHYKLKTADKLGANGKYANEYEVDGNEGSSDVNRYYGLGAQGQWGNFGAGLIVSTEEWGDLKSNKMRKADNSKNVTAGVNYDFGFVKTYLAGNYYDDGLDKKQWGVFASAVAPLGSGELEFGAGYGKNKEEVANDKDKKGDAFTVGAHYKYPLSKRTYAYVAAGYAEEEAKDVSKTKEFQAVSGICHNF